MNIVSSNTNRQQIGVFSITMIVIGAVVTIRTLSQIAIYGTQAIFFVLLAIILYMIPLMIICFEFSMQYPNGIGMYTWARSIFGKKIGFLELYADLLFMILLMPLIITFIVSNLLYVISPTLSDNILLVYVIGLIILFFITYVNLKGLKTSALVSSICTILGIFIPMILIIIIGIYKVIFHPETILLDFNFSNMIPSFNNMDTWTAINSVVLSFTGVEVVTVHVRNVINVKKTYTIALVWLTIIACILYIAAPLTIAMIVPIEDIKLATGILQLFYSIFTEIGVSFLAPIIIILVCIGALGALNSWAISATKPLSIIAKDGLCHKIFATVNKNGVPIVLLICQTILIVVLFTLMQFSPTISDFFWIFSVLACQSVVLVYMIVFFAYLKFIFFKKMTFLNKILRVIMCFAGIFIFIITIIIGFIPSPSISLAVHPLKYVMLLVSGLIIAWLPAIPLYFSGDKK